MTRQTFPENLVYFGRVWSDYGDDDGHGDGYETGRSPQRMTRLTFPEDLVNADYERGYCDDGDDGGCPQRL